MLKKKKKKKHTHTTQTTHTQTRKTSEPFVSQIENWIGLPSKVTLCTQLASEELETVYFLFVRESISVVLPTPEEPTNMHLICCMGAKLCTKKSSPHLSIEFNMCVYKRILNDVEKESKSKKKKRGECSMLHLQREKERQNLGQVFFL